MPKVVKNINRGTWTEKICHAGKGELWGVGNGVPGGALLGSASAEPARVRNGVFSGWDVVESIG